MADDLVFDLEELRQLQSIAKRPRIVRLLSSQIQDLEKLFKDDVSANTSRAPLPVRLPTATTVVSTTTPSIQYTTLETFSWDQDNDKVKIYLSLENVNEEKMEAVFKARSFDVKFHDVGGKNWRNAIPNLNGEIVPEKCKVMVKRSRVIVMLFKASKGNWMDLYHKEDKLKPNLDKQSDPMGGIMDLMKNMYEDGDENMKQTIAKAWTDARSGKGTNDYMKGGFP